MKDLLKKGTVEMPKRSGSIVSSGIVGGASFKAAGYVDYDNKRPSALP